ncbi:MAG: serine/threonine-protein kinase [Phormidesmis sp.]
MTYCIATDCPNPKNALNARHCGTCGSKLWLRDRYRVLGALGQGGFGATFLARDQALPGHPPCVIKQLRPTATEPTLLAMARDLFQREASILGKIGNHPQLPRLLDYFDASQEFYLVQEYVSGSTLQKEVKRNGPFSEAETCEFLTEILPVVQYIHSNKIIHRDIKPANLIRRDQDQRLVMIDFGAVKDKVNPPKINPSDQTALTAYAIGTPGYAPPEQMALRPVYASDLYAIGVTCIYLLTGRSPKDFPYDPQTGALQWQTHAAVSDYFGKVLGKMLDISVHSRYQMAEDILRDLDMGFHLESLSRNMSFASPQQIAEVDEVERVSPSSRMAEAIRARRARRTKSASYSQGRTSSATRGSTSKTAGRMASASTSGLASAATSRGTSRHRPTAQSLKDAYEKGHRDFSEQLFSQLDLSRQCLVGARFAKATLRKTNLTSTDLSNTNLSQANLTRAILKNAKLTSAYLGEANLECADLRGANLNRASLEAAKLEGANLCGADLTDATINEDQLASAKTNWTTIYPNGRRAFL